MTENPMAVKAVTVEYEADDEGEAFTEYLVVPASVTESEIANDPGHDCLCICFQEADAERIAMIWNAYHMAN